MSDDRHEETGLLILERRELEDIVIGEVRIRVLLIDKNRVKVAVMAPRSTPIRRENGRGESKSSS